MLTAYVLLDKLLRAGVTVNWERGNARIGCNAWG